MDLNESWIQIASLFLANAGLIVWFRAESRSDWRHMDAKMDANKAETTVILNSIQSEIKDFHGRLCAVEEKKNQDRQHRRRTSFNWFYC
mgnify:CR=1 FL=1